MKKQNTNPLTEKAVAVTLMLIDESGSMVALKSATEESHLGVVQNIQRECLNMPEMIQFMNTWSFGQSRITEKQKLTKIEPDSELQPLILKPNGSTPLFDAIGTACTQLEQELMRLRITNENTIVNVALFTDGFENSSREFSLNEVKRLIERLKLVGWTFHYYGSDQSVEEMAETMKFNHNVKMANTGEGFKKGMESFSEKSFYSKQEFLKSIQFQKENNL